MLTSRLLGDKHDASLSVPGLEVGPRLLCVMVEAGAIKHRCPDRTQGTLQASACSYNLPLSSAGGGPLASRVLRHSKGQWGWLWCWL